MHAAATANVIEMPPSPPSPAKIDELAKEYSAVKDELLQANLAATAIGQRLDEKANYLREIVKQFGSSHAQKSKILHGIKSEIMVSYGGSTTTDAVAVEQFRLALVKAKKARLLRAIFEKTIRWTLQPQASEIIRGSELSDRLRGLAALCQVYSPKTPSVTVRAKA